MKTKSILSDRLERNGSARAAGKIRCGTKVLTKAAMKNEEAVAIYDQGRRERLRASEIERKIQDLGINYPMYPKNTQHFNVSASDFAFPIFAEKILAEYGEGEGVDRHLYKFPLAFHSNHLLDFFPHRFESHVGENKFRSAYDDNGNRVCETLPAVAPKTILDQRKAGVKRVPRRDWEVRGTCEPRVCQEFRSGNCKFRGQLKFYLPKVSGLGLVSMETSSEYAAENIWSTLNEIKDALGYIPTSNPNHPGQPVFMMSKVQEERTYFDEHGKRVTGLQWVPRLTADIDMGTLLGMNHTALVGAPTAPMVPTAWVHPNATVDAEAVTVVAAEHLQPSVDGNGVAASLASTPDLKAQIAAIEADLEKTGCDRALFLRFVAKKYGDGWDAKAAVVREVHEALQKLMKHGKDLDVVVRSRLLPLEFNVDETRLAAYTAEKFGQWQKSFPKMREVVAHIEGLFGQGREAALLVIEQSSDLITHS
ncbi:hypothetical protein [Paraburkholderia sp. SIMBA_054]|uniref:recombination directionality factor n=1 Tax=Paraburkholderia sp. SIMBA_054 TaxID=3085795 RepID=UPI00397CB7FD